MKNELKPQSITVGAMLIFLDKITTFLGILVGIIPKVINVLTVVGKLAQQLSDYLKQFPHN
jgi:hypothetical protein